MLLSKEKVGKTKTGRRYVVRRVVSVRERFGEWEFTLECGHKEYRLHHPSTDIVAFMMGVPELREKCRLGCFTCGAKIQHSSG
jgi:hypothetical protein